MRHLTYVRYDTNVKYVKLGVNIHIITKKKTITKPLKLMKKFTLFIMMLVAYVATTFAQTPISSPSDVTPGKIYWMSNGQYAAWDYGSAMYFDRIFGDRIALGYFGQYGEGRGGFEDNPEDPDQQFAFIEYRGNLYLYSIGADNFVAHKDDGVFLMDSPTNYVTITENAGTLPDFPWNLKFDGTMFIGGHWGLPENGCLTCSDGNTSSKSYTWQIFEVGEMDNLDEVTKRLAKNMGKFDDEVAIAQDSLMSAYEAAEEFLWDINYAITGGEEFELQAADPSAPNYIWCNEPETTEGSMEGLLDDDDETFFHSCWSGTMETVHWLQIDLGTPIKDFMFSYLTRHNASSDYPQAIEVQGSNDGYDFATIATFDQGLPQANNKAWESANINADQEYKHLRFVVSAPRIYWHMAKFSLRTEKFVSVDKGYEMYMSYLNELAAAIEAAKKYLDKSESTKAEDYYAEAQKVSSLLAYIQKLLSDEDDEETIALIEKAEAVLAKEGIGYPAEAPRAAFRAAIDVAKAAPTTQAGLDLQTALDEYFAAEDITLPKGGEVYTLTFITPRFQRNYLYVESYDEYDLHFLYLTHDTLTYQGLPLPEDAAFTCVDNEDGTFDFMPAEGKYLTIPANESSPGTDTGVIDYKTYFQVIKMYTNKYTGSVTNEQLFGLVALNCGGTFMAPTSDCSYFYTDTLPNFMSAWSSAMVIEPWSPVTEGINAVTVENNAKGIYDLTGRKVENPTKGIYVVDGKITVIK